MEGNIVRSKLLLVFSLNLSRISCFDFTGRFKRNPEEEGVSNADRRKEREQGEKGKDKLACVEGGPLR